jgi:hypothetical protein
MPDLWIEVVRAGERHWLPDSPAHGGVRPQARWGMAWRAAGVYGEPASRERLLGYYAARPAAGRGDTRPGDRLRFHRADVAVRPDAWRAPPIALSPLADPPAPVLASLLCPRVPSRALCQRANRQATGATSAAAAAVPW